MTRRQSYFWKQRVIGLGMIFATVIIGLLFKDTMIAGVITIPMGLVLLFTKKMILVDSYFRDMEEQMERAQ